MEPIFKSKEDVIKVANFLPYPFIITEIETHDTSFESLFFNENLVKEFGYTVQDIPDVDTWYELLYPDENYRNEIRQVWNEKIEKAIINNEKEVKIKVRLKPKDRDEKWYEVKTFFMENFFVLAFVDINNEVILQQKLTDINHNNERMLSILGHDLRNPIANLSAISSMVTENDITNEEFKEMVKVIYQESNLLLGMIETILNWTRLNFNTISIVPIAIDYQRLARNVVDCYSSMIQNKSINVQINLQGFSTKDCDLEIMTVIIRNLLSNAIKFTPTGGDISIYYKDNALVVQDSGVGMSEEKINSIKENNCSSTNGTENEKGIGMGLQLVICFAELNGCTIDFESIPDEGTKVFIRF
ncbi:HAMP domain-containing histidine kinase [Flavobacterium amniphilum]|uniref:sensor histidine kinase n=1 Tax=Flavobacterium amniphilum TaxID=1834035 RepID=UPI00202ABAB0|nr:PAS domain-containing sensor histidine kinase [Flavobacterium amniphilum]MCL9804990.1 HAMP domain-containing histidine kinase [Flavobacterium amniphilum]